MMYLLIGILAPIAVLALLLVPALLKQRTPSTTRTEENNTRSWWKTGKAVKLGLLLIGVLFIEFYPWLESWGEVTPVAFLTSLLAKLKEADRNIILTVVHLLPWVFGAFVAWNILTTPTLSPDGTTPAYNSDGTTPASTKGKKSPVLEKVFKAFLLVLVGAFLLGLAGMIFGPSGDRPSDEKVVVVLNKKGVERRVVGINSPIRITIPESPKSGSINRMTLSAWCARIVSPPVLAGIARKPVERLSSDFRTSFDAVLAEPVRQAMLQNNITWLTIEFLHREYVFREEPECPVN